MCAVRRSSRPTNLWCLSITVNPEGEEAVGEMLLRLTGQSPVTCHHRPTDRSTVAVYFKEPSFWTPGRRSELKSALAAISACGLSLGRPSIRWAPVPPEDWSESWKRHFKPLELGRSLLIRPSWSGRRPKPGQSELVLDPGLSFGTGQHPTTDFCLRELIRLRPRRQPASCLDLGTGSGILALAAARLGYGPVKGLDFDPEAVAVARRNALANGLGGFVQLSRGNVSRLSLRPRHRHAVVCANLTADLLEPHAALVWAQVGARGSLIVAGILTTQFPAISRRFELLGGTLARRRTRREWTSGTFLRGDS